DDAPGGHQLTIFAGHHVRAIGRLHFQAKTPADAAVGLGDRREPALQARPVGPGREDLLRRRLDRADQRAVLLLGTILHPARSAGQSRGGQERGGAAAGMRTRVHMLTTKSSTPMACPAPPNATIARSAIESA